MVMEKSKNGAAWRNRASESEPRGVSAGSACRRITSKRPGNGPGLFKSLREGVGDGFAPRGACSRGYFAARVRWVSNGL